MFLHICSYKKKPHQLLLSLERYLSAGRPNYNKNKQQNVETNTQPAKFRSFKRHLPDIHIYNLFK